MTANIRALMSEPPRPLVLSQKDTDGQLPLGYQKISPKEAQQRAEPVIGLIIHGVLPLDNSGAQVLADRAERFHRDRQRIETQSQQPT